MSTSQPRRQAAALRNWIRAGAALAAACLAVTLLRAADGELTAGAPFIIQHWETDNGLPRNSVIAITQTRDGYLWLGTLNGLVRFDGLRFTIFDQNNTPGLPSNRIVRLFGDSRTNLWVGTETAGVALIANGRVTSLDIGRGTRGGRLSAVCEDATGAVWLYTADGELGRYRQGQVDVWKFGAEAPSNCRALVQEPAGPLWVGVDWGQFSLASPTNASGTDLDVATTVPTAKLDYLLASAQGGYWRLANGQVEKWRTNRLERSLGAYPWGATPIAAACEDRQGNLVVGTLGNGLYWFDAAGKATCLSTNNGLSYNFVLSLQVDREDTLWVGTDGGGLNHVRRAVFGVVEETRGRVVQSVSPDAEGRVWIGYNAIGPGAYGAARWQDGVLQRFGPREGLLNSSVNAVFVAADQRVWAGTWGGLYQFDGTRFQAVPLGDAVNRQISAIYQDRQGRLWFGTQGGLALRDDGGWKVFTTADGLTANDVRALADDRDGGLWVGTAGGGLNRFRDGRFGALRTADGLPSDNVLSLLVDAEGVVWVGTDGGGLARLEAGHFVHFTTREGLASNSVGYLLEDDEGYLWLGSNVGLQRVLKRALNDVARGPTNAIVARVYGRQDGLPVAECPLGTQPGACRTRDGTLWFPTIKGLAMVQPAKLVRNPFPPPVMIESVVVEGALQETNRFRTANLAPITIPPGKGRLELHYTALNLGAPERASFRYRLVPHENGWTEAGKERVARYPKLPPGRYTFWVTACNEDGVWNETGNSLAITVLPPFWQTWWFLTASAAGLLGLIVAVVHYLSTQKLQRQVERLRQQEALEKERARIARDIHDQLGASMTQISLLGELVEGDKDSPDDVAAHARQISQAARDTTRVLDEIVWTVNPSNDTLEGLVTYVCKYAQEYLEVAGLRYRLEVPGELPAASISPEVRHNVFLAAKEAVTNVVRHAQASGVWLRLRLEPGRFSIEIQDDGRGPAGKDSERARSRNGLRNMHKRLADIGGSFAIEPAPEQGTVVRLTAPFNPA